MRHSILAVSLLAAALSLAGCQSMPPQASQAGAPTAPVEAEAGASGSVADDNLNAVLWVQTSAEYRAAAETVYRAAPDQPDAALAQAHWDALLPSDRDHAGATASLKPAVIMATAETVLDNSPYPVTGKTSLEERRCHYVKNKV